MPWTTAAFVIVFALAAYLTIRAIRHSPSWDDIGGPLPSGEESYRRWAAQQDAKETSHDRNTRH